LESKTEKLQLVALPIEVEIKDCTVTILEVAKLLFPYEAYQASVQAKCGDTASNIFHVVYKDAKELEAKLIIEVSKFKYALFLYGSKELRARGLAV